MRKTLVGALLVMTACGTGNGGRPAPEPATAPAAAAPAAAPLDACASAMTNLDDALKDPTLSDPDGARQAVTAGFTEACRRDGWSPDAIACFAAVEKPLDANACSEKLTEAQVSAMEAVFDEVQRTKRRPTKIRPPIEIAKAMARKYAFEGYPMWAVEHPAQPCPKRLDEVAAVIDGNDPAHPSDLNDPWGRPYVMFCGDAQPAGKRVLGLGVMSLGPDGARDTADDIKSWE